MSAIIKTIQTVSITSALMGAGGTATFSFFDIPELKSQPADRSLPMIRWLFSRGSHIFPQTGMVSAAGFLYLAYASLPDNLRSIAQLFKTTNGARVNGYIAAALLSISLAPFTIYVMLPNNFALIKKNEEKGGARSTASAEAKRRQGYQAGQRQAEDSVESKGEASEYRDLSGPQSKTEQSSTQAEDEEVRKMLDKFAAQNVWRVVGLGLGGIVGLVTALS